MYLFVLCGNLGIFSASFDSLNPKSFPAFLFFIFLVPQPLPTYSGYPRATVAPPQPLQKFRVRTVFTDSQIKQLEALFEVSDYPAAETRAEVARRTGLSEETVRVSPRNTRVNHSNIYTLKL